jgi:nitrite reductase (NAD(P)H)
MHKRNFSLTSGSCLNDDNYKILTFEVKVEDDGTDDISILLPEPEALEEVIGTGKWMVKSGTAKALDGVEHNVGGIELVGPDMSTSACGGGKLDW